ncbi:MAG: sulfotransferase [Thermodesulfobacteriota bacterium]
MTSDKAFAITSFEDRLSRFFAGRPGLCRYLGNLESKFFRDEIEDLSVDRPVYVTGLTRSGSTILLELLAAHEQTAAHQYRDYPLVCIPLWWNRFVDLAGGGRGEPVERFHRDGIRVTPRSPEAMEEILWMMFFPDCHASSRSQVMDGRTRYPAFESFYRDQIRKILYLRRGSRYLAKANYHVTRLAYLKTIFPDARFVIPVRSPVAQAASLSRQHRLFCEAEARDPRVLNYMRIAGHFEFGLDRRPVNTGCGKTADRIMDLWNSGQEARGLGLLWASVYRYVGGLLAADDALRAASIVVDHDDFCRFPEKILAKIYDHCGLTVDLEFLRQKAKTIFPPREDRPFPFTREEQAAIEAEAGEAYAAMRRFTG